MRLSAIILSLFLSAIISHAFCREYRSQTDTTKHTIKKHYKRYPSWARVRYSLPEDKLYYNDCVFTHKYTISQRLNKYPFSKAAKILAVSYNGGGEPNMDILTNGDTVDAITQKKIAHFKPHGLILKDDTLDHSSLFELKQLTSTQINRLTNMMFNTSVKVPNDYVDMPYTCFNPRNAFIFLDKNGKAFDYIEICFECKRTESKSGKIFLGAGCNQKLDMTKKFLISLGIKYGTLTIKDSDMEQ